MTSFSLAENCEKKILAKTARWLLYFANWLKIVERIPALKLQKKFPC